MNKGLIINEDVWSMIDELEPEEKAELLTVLSAYYQGEEIPEAGRIVRMVFKRIASDNVRFDPDHRKEISEARAAAGQKGAQARWQTMANDGKNGNLPQDKNRKDKNRVDEIREEKKIRASLPPMLDTQEVAKALEDFKAMRKAKRKPMTVRAEELMIKELTKLSEGDPEQAVEILNQSTKNGWTGVYALKSDVSSVSFIDRKIMNWEAL